MRPAARTLLLCTLALASCKKNLDRTAPEVTAFAVPPTSSSLAVPVTAFAATDDDGVFEYLVTESATPPSATAQGWTSSPPATYTVAADGSYTLWAWARDAAGNISAPREATVVVDAPPTVTAFIVPATSRTLVVAISSFTTGNGADVTGYLVTESGTPPAASDPEWSPTPLTSVTLAGRGHRTLYAWAKDAAGHVSVPATANVDATARITVLFTTDEHSHLLATPEVDDFPLATSAGSGAIVGGVARRATLLATERATAAARADTLTLSAGDFSQGTLASAAFLALAPDLVVMKKLGYDAVALGNHEFDLGPAALAGAIASASKAGGPPPLVLTNAYFDAASPADDALEALYGAGKAIAPSRVVVTPNGLRVGIVAVMGVGAATAAAASAPLSFWDPAVLPTARFDSIVTRVQQAVTGLRNQDQVDAVVVLGHGGIGLTPGTSGDDELLAAKVTGIDLVVSGHTHLSTPAPRLVQDPDGRSVPVVQAKAYGEEVGRVELVFDGAPRPALDPARTAFLRVDDRILPTTDTGIRGVLATTMGSLETGVGAVPSFLERALTHVDGTPVTHDPAFLGSLYFRPLCHTTFDVTGLDTGESNGMNLDTDAMLAAANAVGPTVAALQNRGSIRADLRVGRTGKVTFADVYDVVPLGADPTVIVTGSAAAQAAALTEIPGYPLVRFWLSTAELRAALEASLLMATRDPDYFVGPSGLAVAYDATRAPFDLAQPLGPGWITRIATVNDAGAETGVLYDVAQAGVGGTHFLGDPAALQPVAATYYVASFAQLAGVTLRDAGGAAITPAAAILRRGDGSAVKDHEALAGFIKAQCTANFGEMPARYGDAVPRRMVPAP